jgi:hypothetical protein
MSARDNDVISLTLMRGDVRFIIRTLLFAEDVPFLSNQARAVANLIAEQVENQEIQTFLLRQRDQVEAQDK